MEQTKALNALEPFLALSKSASSPRAAADLVTRATSNPNTFLFAELLQTPQIQSLAQSAEHAAYLTLLRIFSYGTYADYQRQQQQSPQSLPDLSEGQALKLRQLSLLTLARDRTNLAYPRLQTALSLPDTRALEALVTSAIYAGLIQATLDPARQHVHVTALAPLRDLAPDSIPALSDALRTWSDRCAATLHDIDAQTAAIRAEAARRQRHAGAREERLAELVAETKHSGGGAGGGLLSGVTDAARRAGHSMRERARVLSKRGSNLMETADQEDEEAMDLDLEEEEQKRASRRKL
ncbi:COP9 signalosome complex subunit 7a like protein [Verticillium longisporum]|uniref:COP9 signalosome complex subunit 7a like protein n=1 Tax=Verticillium longisporum TaxID=100787 RepID=A0A8I2ZVY5_VERLO|nr:COP9 signalosome complex subunit 7a like protein [Verticillium longisporum]